MNGQNLTKFCIHIIIDTINFGNVKHHFLKNFNRVTARNLCQNLVFAQYLENEWTEFNQLLYRHLYNVPLKRSMSGLLPTLSFSSRVMLLNISLSSDSAMAGL